MPYKDKIKLIKVKGDRIKVGKYWYKKDEVQSNCERDEAIRLTIRLYPHKHGDE